MYYSDLSSFYKSKEWKELIKILRLKRVDNDGILRCKHCGKPIIKSYDCIAHHNECLTLENVNDCNISLNPDNIELVHFACHNEIHNRFGKYTRHIYLVYGSPLAGKTTYIKEVAGIHDLIIDTNEIYACITNNNMYIKSNRLYDNATDVYDVLLGQVKRGLGKWVNAFIVGTFPYSGERERIINEYGAEEIFIECDKETALSRLATDTSGRNKTDYTKYIDNWFDRFSC